MIVAAGLCSAQTFNLTVPYNPLLHFAMGNTGSFSSADGERKQSKRKNKTGATDVATRAKQVVGDSVRDLQANIHSQIKLLEEQDHPAAHFLDSVCGAYMDDRDDPRRGRRTASFYSEDFNSDEEDERTFSEDETTAASDYNGKRGRGKEKRRDDPSEAGDTASFLESDYESQEQKGRPAKKKTGAGSQSFESEGEDSYSRNEGESEKSTVISAEEPAKIGASNNMPVPLASSFAKRCYFTKAGIGSTTQHYEGLTLTGNVVLMLAQAMKLKGCPTICDEDLRRVEQTYPNQFSRLPDELLLSSGWRRISKYCHFSYKAIPDGVPFFHSKQRLHPNGGYYFLLASAVGMVRPIDVEPLTRDTLVLLETDFPGPCDAAPKALIEDPDQWTLVDKFCFFSGGPINTDEDVYYQAVFDGNAIFMLAFLSPSLTPTELYKLDINPEGGEPGLPTVASVQEVESVYDLTDRDFDDLRLYHLGPCRALPQYILQPNAWTKVLPNHFLVAREIALQRAEEYERATYGGIGTTGLASMMTGPLAIMQQRTLLADPARSVASSSFSQPPSGIDPGMQFMMAHQLHHQHGHHVVSDAIPIDYGGISMQPMMQHPHQVPLHTVGMQFIGVPHPFSPEEEMIPMDEAQESSSQPMSRATGIDPPEDEPPSLTRRGEGGDEDPRFAGQHAHYSQAHMHPYGYNDQHRKEIHAYPDSDISLEDKQPLYPNNPRPRKSFHEENQMHYHDDHQSTGQLVPHYPVVERPTMSGSLKDTRYSSAQRRIAYNNDGQPVNGQQKITSGENLSYYEEPEQDGYYAHRPDSLGYHPQTSLDYTKDSPVGYEDDPVHDEETPSRPLERSIKHNFSDDPSSSHGLPKNSNQSQMTSDISHTSSAMRGARELLKRNRQKRLDIATRRSQDPPYIAEPSYSPKDVPSPHSDSFSGSEVTSIVSATSSAWTENSSAPERSSRRALILQMAKARMKNNKSGGASLSNEHHSELMGTYSITEEEKKLDGPAEDEKTDIDIAGDLD